MEMIRRHRRVAMALRVGFVVSLFTLMVMLSVVVVIDKIRPAPVVGYCERFPDESPEMVLNGEEEMIVKKSESFDDPGVTTDDTCSVVEVVVTGSVNTAKPGEYVLGYVGTNSRGQSVGATRTVRVIERYAGTIYLTFDDGPGDYTGELLDVLAKYNVKATFFVTGAGEDALIRREYQEGHAVGLHTLSHNYAYVYSSTENFWEDLYAVRERVKNATGGYESNLMRFPGGSSNLVSTLYDGGSHIMTKLTREAKAKGFSYFDWNVMSGDTGETTLTDEVYDNVVQGLIEDGESVVLQHDIKGFSVATVEKIIKYGLSHGYEFRKLDEDSFGAHHGVNN